MYRIKYVLICSPGKILTISWERLSKRGILNCFSGSSCSFLLTIILHSFLLAALSSVVLLDAKIARPSEFFLNNLVVEDPKHLIIVLKSKEINRS